MGLLIGTFNAKVGSKGRFSLPPQLKAHLNGRLIFITPHATGGDHSALTDEGRFEEWARAKGETVVPWIYANAYPSKMDSVGRVLIPHEAREAAKIEKGEQIVLLGYGDCVRIMKKADWEAFKLSAEQRFDPGLK